MPVSTRWIVLPLAAVLLAAPAEAVGGTERRYVPHIALSRCAQGFWDLIAKGCWETEVILRNRSGSPAKVSLFWYEPSGSSFVARYRSSASLVTQEKSTEREPLVIRLGGRGVAAYTFTLPPVSRGFWEGLFDLSTADRSGWMIVEIERENPADASGLPSDEIEIFAIYRFRKRGRATNQAYVPTVLPAKGFSSYVKRSGGDYPTNMGFGLANPSEEEALVRFIVRDREGKEVKLLNPFSVRIVPHGQMAKMMDELIPTEMGEIEGTLEITANVPIVATGLQMTGKPGEAVLSTIPHTASDQ